MINLIYYVFCVIMKYREQVDYGDVEDKENYRFGGRII